MSRRVLMVAFHYPPCRGSSGLQRSLSFSKGLLQFDWHPVMLSACSRAYEQTGQDQTGDIPTDIPVHRAFALDTARHLACGDRYPGFLAVPDRWVSWVISAIPAGMRLIRRYRPDVLWSTYPIATAHIIGYALHRLTGLPWVADFRDPMVERDPVTGQEWPADPRVRRARRWIERRTMTHAARAVFVAPGAMRIYVERYPHVPPDRWALIPNGYDEDSFVAAEELIAPTPTLANRVTLLHSGVLYASPDRDPTEFFKALSQLRQTRKVSSSNLKVILRASGFEDLYRTLLQRFGIQDIVSLESAIPYREALAEMLQVDGLLLFQGHDSNPAIPAKLYEYLRARKPILALVDSEGDTARTLKELGAGTIVSMTSADDIAVGLVQYLDQVRNRSAPLPSEEIVRSLSRTSRSRELAKVFDNVIGG